jgi:hypothetical protein
MLLFACAAVFVATVALFYGIEWRFYAEHRYVYLRSEWDEVPDFWGNVAGVAFYLGPLVLGAVVYVAVVVASPARLRRSRWRDLLALPLATLGMLALWVALLAPWFFYSNRPS